jgi:hypothetical protein
MPVILYLGEHKVLKQRVFALVITFLVLLGSGCTQAGGSRAAQAAEDYLRALAAKDADRIAALSCAQWEPDARLEVDSFQAVDVRLENLACEETGQEDSTTLVVCHGKLVATYNNEDQEIDLSSRTYQIVSQDGEYLVCGYR